MAIKTLLSQRANMLRAAVLLGTVVFVAAVIFPIFGQIQKSSERLAQTLQEERILKDQIAAIQDYKKIAKEVRANLDTLRDMLVNVQFPVNFVQFLENLAGENGLSIDISFLSGGGESGQAVFQLSLSGSSANLTRFIARLEAGPYLVKIKQIQMQRSEQNQVSANISLTVLTK